jgi:nicotinate-nucleotide adenylyltransferase
MVRLAIKTNRDFSVSDIEIKRGGVSYTIQTLQEFKRMYPEAQLYFITGSDLLKYLDEWKDINQILEMVDFVVARRPGYPLEMVPSYMKTLEIRAVDISGFQIREYIKEGRSIRYLVPDSVLKYINKKGFYR